MQSTLVLPRANDGGRRGCRQRRTRSSASCAASSGSSWRACASRLRSSRASRRTIAASRIAASRSPVAIAVSSARTSSNTNGSIVFAASAGVQPRDPTRRDAARTVADALAEEMSAARHHDHSISDDRCAGASAGGHQETFPSVERNRGLVRRTGDGPRVSGGSLCVVSSGLRRRSGLRGHRLQRSGARRARGEGRRLGRAARRDRGAAARGSGFDPRRGRRRASDARRDRAPRRGAVPHRRSARAARRTGDARRQAGAQSGRARRVGGAAPGGALAQAAAPRARGDKAAAQAEPGGLDASHGVVAHVDGEGAGRAATARRRTARDVEAARAAGREGAPARGRRAAYRLARGPDARRGRGETAGELRDQRRALVPEL